VLVHEQSRGLLRDELECLVVGVRGRVWHPAVRKLADRPRRLSPLEQVEADVDLAGDLDAGEADLPVAHRGVHVADREHPTGLANGEVDPCPNPGQVVVEVAAVTAGEP
jgi:hypothetical protein